VIVILRVVKEIGCHRACSVIVILRVVKEIGCHPACLESCLPADSRIGFLTGCRGVKAVPLPPVCSEIDCRGAKAFPVGCPVQSGDLESSEYPTWAMLRGA
jgi:hypothetical protein